MKTVSNIRDFTIRNVGIALAAYRPDPVIFEEQLKTIQNQTFTRWICVITCDSPLDPLRSEARLRPFFEDRRFIWSENPTRLGHKKNFERAMNEAARHDVDAVGCADQDDVWYPEKIARSVEELGRRGRGSLVHSDMHELRGGKILEKTTWATERRGVHYVRPEHLMIRNVVAGCSMLMDAELIRRFPVIPDASEYHDHWYALIAAFYGGAHPIEEPLFAYRQHGGNTVGVTPFQKIFALPKGSTPLSLARKCRNGWMKSHRFAQAALEAGLPLTEHHRSLFIEKSDLGTGILKMGIEHREKDPPLSRACIARSIGKALSVV